MKKEKENKAKEKNKKKTIIEIIVMLVIIVVFAVATFFLYKEYNEKQSEENKLLYTELVKEIQAGNVEKIEMTIGSAELKVKLKDTEKEKTTLMPSTQVLTELIQEEALEANEIELETKTQPFLKALPDRLLTILPTAIMIILVVMIFKMQGLGDKGKVYDEAERKTKVSFDDIAGLDEEKEELKEIVEFLKKPKKFAEMGAKIPKGVLLYGKPGTGKL